MKNAASTIHTIENAGHWIIKEPMIITLTSSLETHARPIFTPPKKKLTIIHIASNAAQMSPKWNVTLTVVLEEWTSFTRTMTVGPSMTLTRAKPQVHHSAPLSRFSSHRCSWHSVWASRSSRIIHRRLFSNRISWGKCLPVNHLAWLSLTVYYSKVGQSSTV